MNSWSSSMICLGPLKSKWWRNALLDTLNMPYRVGNHQIHNSVSIGIVLRAQAQGNADAILQKASIAVAEAKRAGAGRYVIFEAAMQERAAQRGE